MRAAHAFRALGPIDARSIRRDSMLLWMSFLPLAIGALTRWLLPELTEILQSEFAFDLTPYRHLVASYLFVYEAIERLVLVEGPDDVVAIAKGVAERDVLVQTVGVCVASDIEPMPAPTFAIVRGLEQPLDDSLVGVWSRIRKERLDLILGWR